MSFKGGPFGPPFFHIERRRREFDGDGVMQHVDTLAFSRRRKGIILPPNVIGGTFFAIHVEIA